MARRRSPGPRRAAPHTRGSTHPLERTARTPSGCPAHAGIDPRTPRAVRPTARLPRTRGDRPAYPALRVRAIGAAPHTRGSTRWGLLPRSAQRGCPAHAGIDLVVLTAGIGIARLPRTRGDRPARGRSLLRHSAAAPHTRGSTPAPRRARRPLRGCPAHAGIDPGRPELRDARRRLPRTRGDRPGSTIDMKPSFAAAPHTRGSTPLAGRNVLAVQGCPAHAGIDPRSASASSSFRWLPRTRGDRPKQCGLAKSRAAAAPHTRGSTPRRLLPRRLVRGCPAHAGIDPRTDARGR